MFDSLIGNFHNPTILFFILGILAVSLKSDLEIPGQIAKFLSMYLLFDIGMKGGGELFHSGFSLDMFNTLSVCGIISFVTPFICYRILRLKMDIYNAGAIAASYGSISAINFINSTSFLEQNAIPYSGYMVASMALMEFPAVISGLLIIGMARKKLMTDSSEPQLKMRKVIHEALFNGSVFLLVGSLLIGYICGSSGEADLKPFVKDIFKGVLCFYMLDMGLLAGQKIKSLKNNFFFLASFALAYPVISAALAILLAKFLGMSVGNALLFTTLISSASFIAVPAAMRMAVPQANMGIILPMSLGITFVFNIIFGVPLYLPTIQYLWANY